MPTADDILVVCGLEQQIAGAPHVLPPAFKTQQEFNEHIAHLIEDFPGMLVVVRSVFQKGNILFSKREAHKTRNIPPNHLDKLTDARVNLSRGMLEELMNRDDPLDDVKMTTGDIHGALPMFEFESFDKAKVGTRFMKYFSIGERPDMLGLIPNENATIFHDKVNEALRVPQYCTQEHQYQVMDIFTDALVNRKHATVVAFRPHVSHEEGKVRDFGFGLNVCTRAHDFMNATIEERHAVIPPYFQAVEGDRRDAVVEILNSPPVPQIKARTKLFEYIASIAASRSCNRNKEQMQVGGDGFHYRTYASAVNHAIGKSHSPPYTSPPYTAVGQYTQRVMFAGNSPSQHCLKITANSLVPLEVHERDDDDYVYRVNVDLRAEFLQPYMSLTKPNTMQECSYGQLLHTSDTPIFRHILLTTSTKEHNSILPDFNKVDNNITDKEGPYALIRDNAEYKKHIDVGCIIKLIGNSSTEFVWSDNVFPVDSSMRDLETYRATYDGWTKLFGNSQRGGTPRIIDPAIRHEPNMPIIKFDNFMIRTDAVKDVHGNMVSGPALAVMTELGVIQQRPQKYVFMDFSQMSDNAFINEIKGNILEQCPDFYTQEQVVYVMKKYMSRMTADDLDSNKSPKIEDRMLHPDGRPVSELLVKNGRFLKQPSNVRCIVSFVNIGDTVPRGSSYMASTCLKAPHLIVVVFGDFKAVRAPTVEELYLTFPYANYIANFTWANSHNYIENEDDKRFAEALIHTLDDLNTHIESVNEDFGVIDSDDE